MLTREEVLCIPMDQEYELPHVPGVRGKSTIAAVGYRHLIGGTDNSLGAGEEIPF